MASNTVEKLVADLVYVFANESIGDAESGIQAFTYTGSLLALAEEYGHEFKSDFGLQIRTELAELYGVIVLVEEDNSTVELFESEDDVNMRWADLVPEIQAKLDLAEA